MTLSGSMRESARFMSVSSSVGPRSPGTEGGFGQQDRAPGVPGLDVVVDPLEHRRVLLDGHRRPGLADRRDFVADLEVPDLGIRAEDAVDDASDVAFEEIVVADEAEDLEPERTDGLDDRVHRFRTADLHPHTVQPPGPHQGRQRVLIRPERPAIGVDADVRRPLLRHVLRRRGGAGRRRGGFWRVAAGDKGRQREHQ